MNWFPFPFPRLLKNRLIWIGCACLAGIILVALGAAIGGHDARTKPTSAGPVARADATVTVHATVTRTPKPALPASCQRLANYITELYGDLDTYEQSFGQLRDSLDKAQVGINANDPTVLNLARQEINKLNADTSTGMDEIITLYADAQASSDQCKGDTK